MQLDDLNCHLVTTRDIVCQRAPSSATYSLTRSKLPRDGVDHRDMEHDPAVVERVRRELEEQGIPWEPSEHQIAMVQAILASAPLPDAQRPR